MTEAKKHATNYAPSSAKRWLSCPFSAFVSAMYSNEETDASLKGDYWHAVMEDMITFGTVPPHIEPDIVEAMLDLYEYVKGRVAELGKSSKLYIEQRLDIPEINDFGTVDIGLVSDTCIEVIDEKSGYVPVDVKLNPQLILYLLGLIAKYGERKHYRITLHQPNYDHIDGQIRSYDVSTDDLDWVRQEIKYSLANADLCTAGKHCKETYCNHRGACEAFAEYVKNDLGIGWHTSEVKAVSDMELGRSLDSIDGITGYRTELRSEAMKRIINMDRQIPGYKVVKGRRSREVKNALNLVNTVHDTLGYEWALKLFNGMQWAEAAFKEAITGKRLSDAMLKHLGTPKHIEDIMKLYAQQMKLPRGGWKGIYDNVVGPYIRETAEGLTLEKAIDGRPAHRRGSEFGEIQAPQGNQAVTII